MERRDHAQENCRPGGRHQLIEFPRNEENRTSEPTGAMKRILICVAVALAAVTAYAQGSVNFVNRVAGSVDAPVFDVGGTTKFAGPNAFAQLYAGPLPTSLAPVGDPIAFRTGTGAGYWPSQERSIPTVAPGATAFIQVLTWKDASTYESASIRCASCIFSVVTGGAGSPPSLPADLVGLAFCCVPEPSTLVLGLLGAGFLLLRRRS